MNRAGGGASWPEDRESTDREASDLEDRSLVRAAVGGDTAAFDRIYRKYRERVYRVAFKVLRNREDALEASQEVFVKAYRSLERFDPDSRFFTWIYRIAMNQAIDTFRRRRTRREQEYDEVLDSPPKVRRDVTAALERSEIAERIEEALGHLSEKHKTVFLLYSFEELSYTEISEVLGIPIGTVMSRLYYARKQIRGRLPDEWDPGGPRRREDRRRD